jgi:hypothetical protein
MTSSSRTALVPMIWPGRDHDGARKARRRSLMAAWPARPRLLLTSPMFDKSWLADAGGSVPGWDVSEDIRTLAAAEAVVFHLPQVSGIERLAKPPGQVWIGVSAECDVYYPQQVAPDLLSRLDVVASYHQDSDFPLNYTSPARLHELLRPVPEKQGDALVCALISNGHSRSGREARVIELERWLPVHHYGRWRSTHRREDFGRATKLDILGRYRFSLAYENCIDRDYVTEKWFDCLLAGCVPVYLGAPNIAEFAPAPDSYIDATAFSDAAALARHLHAVASSPASYAQFFAWKNRPLPAAFVRLFEGQEIPFLRRLCAWLDNERVAGAAG